MAPRRKSAAAASNAASAEAAVAASSSNEAPASAQTTTEAAASAEATATRAIPSSVSEHRGQESDASEDESISPMEVDDAEDDAPSSEASKEVDSLNELLVIFYDIMILTYYTRVRNSTRTKRVFIWSAVMAPLYRAPCLRHARFGSCRNKKGGATQVHSP